MHARLGQDSRRRRLAAAVASAAAAVWLACAPGALAVTLEDAVRAALKTNPQIGAVIENRRAVDHELSQARSGFLPTIDLNASSGKEYANNATTRGRQLDGDDSRTTSLATSAFTLSIRQLLFDGFNTLSAVERQEARVRSAARRVRETSELIGLDTAEAYLESLRQRELIRINEENIRAHEIFLELVRARVLGGASGKAEEEQARQRLAAARDVLAQSDGLRRDADARYRRIVGEEPIAMVRPVTPVDALPATINRAIELAVRFNPTIRVARSDVLISEAEYKQTLSGQWPQLSFEVNANTNRNAGGERGGSHALSALLVMNYNLYRGGADIARRSEFVARLGEARQRLAQAQRNTDENTRVAWNALVNARDRLTQLRAIVQANANIRDNFKKEFDIGRRDLIDLLNAESDYFQSRGNLVSAEFVEMLGVYRILAATGVLLATLDVAPSDEAYVSDTEGVQFENTLQGFVEQTPVLDVKQTLPPTGTAPVGTGTPDYSKPLPGLPPLPGGVIDPTVPLPGGPAGIDLMSPLGAPPGAPSGGAVLDPTAPLPVAPEGTPQGVRPTPLEGAPREGPVRLAPLRQAARQPVPAYTDKPALQPSHAPDRMNLRRPSEDGPASRTAAASTLWGFGPANAAAPANASPANASPTNASPANVTGDDGAKPAAPAPRAPAWGFD